LEQVAYYKARAEEYDEWFLRKGRYDRGEDHTKRWFAEVAHVRQALEAFCAAGNVLELAGGTGLWTQELVGFAKALTVVDSSGETLAINRCRAGEANARAIPLRYIEADLFDWSPDTKYDVVFFSFWLSHVPVEKFEEFWRLVRNCLAPGGRVFLVDSLYTEDSTAANHKLEGAASTMVLRKLNDGQTFRVVKVFYDPEQLEDSLAGLGWMAKIQRTPTFFLYGEACLRSA